MKDTVFYFEFGVDDEFINKGFIIENYEFRSDDQDKCDKFEYICSDIEGDYGVHDWCTGPDDRVDGIGYYSNEVEDDQIDNLMEVWRQVFIKEGATVSGVVDFEREYEDSDYDIYLKVKTGLAPEQ